MYTPPQNPIFEFGGLTYVPPIADGRLSFVFGDVDVDSIRTADINLALLFDTHIIVDGFLINTSNLELTPTFNTSQVVPLVHVARQDMIVNSTFHAHDVEICPDIINEDAEVQFLFDPVVARTPEENDLPFRGSSGLSLGFFEAGPVDIHKNQGWDTPSEASITSEIANLVGYDKQDYSNISGFQVLTTYNTPYTIPWYQFETYDSTYAFGNLQLLVADTTVTQYYGYFNSIEIQKVIGYREPGPKDIYKTLPWDVPTYYDIKHNVPYIVPMFKDIHKNTPWGPFSYYTLCMQEYEPPPATHGVHFRFPPKYPLLEGVCKNIVFDMSPYSSDPRCGYNHLHSGERDNYTYPIIIPVPERPDFKEAYYMINTCLVKRLPSDEPIEVLAVNATIDKSSWLWQFRLTIGDEQYLDLIKPDPGNLDLFTDIEININGWKFTCRVESWNETIAFGKTAWNVVGRSPSMELGNPQNPPTSHTYSPGRTDSGQAVIDAVLQGTILGIDNTGWTLDWSLYQAMMDVYSGFDAYDPVHWGIPNNALSWENKTQQEVVKMLLDSIGAYAQTVHDCASDKRLVVKPQYNIPPWHWRGPTEDLFNKIIIDHDIPASLTKEVGRGFNSLNTYNAVYVMGESNTTPQDSNPSEGIAFVEAFREGWGPGMRTYGQNISNPLLYTWKACAELGRMSLCNTGEWMNQSLRLFSMAIKDDNNSDLIGLVTPGEMIQYAEPTKTWFGMVSSTNIDVRVVGGSACSVTQTIEVDQYIGE